MRASLRGAAGAILLGLFPLAAGAQGVALQLGRLFDDGGWTTFGVAWVQPVLGPASLSLGGVFVRGPAPAGGRLWGASADLALFRGGRPGAYAVGGVSGGLASGTSDSWWGSWSAGVGYEIIPVRFLSLGVEGRYRDFGAHARSGVELSFRVGTWLGGSGARAGKTRGTPAPAPLAPAPRMPMLATRSGHPVARSDAASVLDGVIATADSVVGTRYRFGGREGDGQGFDCSGLIQYAYARHGIALPRRSTDQALQGREVGRQLAELHPGDLLTFSAAGHGVTHVGLYIGGGRFIHSASSGVQTSTLSATDPYGKWWFARWVGTRRLVETDA